jgi:hypothetical protein
MLVFGLIEHDVSMCKEIGQQHIGVLDLGWHCHLTLCKHVTYCILLLDQFALFLTNLVRERERLRYQWSVIDVCCLDDAAILRFIRHAMALVQHIVRYVVHR